MNTPSSPDFRQQLAHDRLRGIYHAWLATVRTEHGRTGAVAGHKTRQGFEAANQLMLAAPGPWRALQQAWIDTPERVFVWSDHHLFHKNICRYAGRPFDSLHRMHEVMAANAAHLTDDDFVIFGGDISFGNKSDTQQWLRQIKGHKFLIAGNHDVDRPHKIAELKSLGFEGVGDALVLDNGERLLWVTHYPLQAKDIPERALNIHGHIHQHLIDGAFVNMCVEHLDYTPQRLTEILGRR